jgi:hypothetical protein
MTPMGALNTPMHYANRFCGFYKSTNSVVVKFIGVIGAAIGVIGAAELFDYTTTLVVSPEG